jgi:hypothetical protein
MARPRGDDLPHGDETRFPLRFDRLCLAVVDHVARRAMGRLADEDAVHRGGGLEPRGGVDDVAGDDRLAGGDIGVECDERLARVDGRADLEIRRAVADRDRRQHRTNGIVLVRHGCAEDGHHSVADELLHRAAALLDLLAEPGVVRREHRAHVLRVELLGAAREADEVGEEDRHDLPFLAAHAATG